MRTSGEQLLLVQVRENPRESPKKKRGVRELEAKSSPNILLGKE